MKLARGANRCCLLVGRWAIKFPRLNSWHDFLYGLLNNLHEASRPPDPRLCPITWACPGGFVNIMPRCVPYDGSPKGLRQFATGLPVEPHAKSFGWLPDGRLVAFDYGWPT